MTIRAAPAAAYTSAERITDLCGQVTSLLQQVEQLQQRVNEMATDYAGLAAD